MEIDKVTDELADMMKWKLAKKWKGAMARDVSPVAMFLIELS